MLLSKVFGWGREEIARLPISVRKRFCEAANEIRRQENGKG